MTVTNSVDHKAYVPQQVQVGHADPKALKESEGVKPRQAPAASSQKGDQKPLESKEERPPPKHADADRGKNVDVHA